MDATNSQFVGWTAVIGGVVGLIGFVSLILLFVVGEPFGTLNDVLSIPTALLLMPLVFALYRQNAAHYSWVSLFAVTAGLIGFLATAIGSVLLVSGRINFEQSLVYGIGGFGLIGLWALLNSVMGLAGHALPKTLAWAGILLGVTPTLALLAVFRVNSIGNMLSATAGQTAAAQFSPLAYLFFIAGGISYGLLPVWFILMGRLFLAGRVLISAATA
ncbi:MAG: hypothetical protein KA586_11200 [Candidatus Promineofilum sp.]|nr:hypothetical protein [Promineifilum sp.]